MPDPTPTDWGSRYAAGTTPWDLGRAHPELVDRLPALGPPGRVVVPGAGTGHDARALAQAGWQVTAIEFVARLADRLHNAVGPAGQVVIADALDWAPEEDVDLVFDHTFFCAIPLRRRPEFGSWAATVLRPGGRIASCVFPFGRPLSEGGPPFGMSTSDLAGSLGSGFELTVDEPAAHPRRRPWSTRWAEFVRLPA